MDGLADVLIEEVEYVMHTVANLFGKKLRSRMKMRLVADGSRRQVGAWMLRGIDGM